MRLLHTNSTPLLYRLNQPFSIPPSPISPVVKFGTFVASAVSIILRMHLSKTVSTCESIFKCVVFKLPILTHTHTYSHTNPTLTFTTYFGVESKRELTETIFRRYHQISMYTQAHTLIHKPQIYCCLLCVWRWRSFIVIVFPHIDQLSETVRKKVNNNEQTNKHTKSRLQIKGEKAHTHTRALIQHRDQDTATEIEKQTNRWMLCEGKKAAHALLVQFEVHVG